MRVDELNIPDEVCDALVSAGFKELHPPQAEAIPQALEGRNLVVAIPTASGKSLIGMIPALKILYEHAGKVLYIVPLKALASEKKDDFDRFADRLGFTTYMSTGDLDSDGRGIDRADVVIATSEKTDSLLRHGSQWIDGVRLVIADEIHTIHDPGRGPTLEVAITKMLRKLPEMQLIALSATISNADDLARWLGAGLVKSDWRPVPLKEGVCFGSNIRFNDGEVRDLPLGDPLEGAVRQALNEGGQCLVFVNSRRSTEAVAVELSSSLKLANALTKQERAILEGEPDPTALGIKLATCAAKGVAFHNAGLSYRQRKMVEDSFKSGRVKCIVATPTLAAGINLPARRVVVRECSRFGSGGYVSIPVMEVKQMCGRAGRPGYDPYGEAVLMAKSEEDADHLMADYINHDTERVTSKLFDGNAIRNHLLGIISTGDADSEKSLIEFVRHTFFGSTTQMFGIESVVHETIDFLAENGMVERDGDKVYALPFGKRVSDLYIDPLSASMLRIAIDKIDKDTDVIPILIAISMTPDVLGMNPRKADKERIKTLMDDYEDLLLLDPYSTEDYIPELFPSDVKTAIVMNDWISELSEKYITDAYGIGPGDIRSRTESVEWMAYAMSEIAYFSNPSVRKIIKPVVDRIRYGIKEELLDIISIKGIGRTRARVLYDKGFRSRSDIAFADRAKLSSVPGIGPTLSDSLIREAKSNSKRTRDDMIDEMAEAYGESPQGGGTEPRQSRISDFRLLRQDLLDVGDGVPALYGRGAVVDDGVRILQTVTGADADDPLVPIYDAFGAELLQSGDRCGGGGLHADALLPSQELLRDDDLLVGDRRGISPSGVNGLQSLLPADRVAYPYGGGDRLRVLLGDEVVRMGGERPGYGRGPLGLDAREHRDLLYPTYLFELHACLVHGPYVRRVPNGEDDPVRDVVPELVHDLEQNRLLTLRPVGVDRVEKVQLLLLGHAPGERERIVEVPVYGQDLGSEE